MKILKILNKQNMNKQILVMTNSYIPMNDKFMKNKEYTINYYRQDYHVWVCLIHGKIN